MTSPQAVPEENCIAPSQPYIYVYFTNGINYQIIYYFNM